MTIFPNRSLAGPQAPALSMARDVIRIVITAVLAGTAFALLLAMTVLSLTVIAPPAQASGAPALASSEPVQGRGTDGGAPGQQDASPVHLASQTLGTPAAAQASPPQVSTHQSVFDSLPKNDKSPALLYLLLALGAGFLGLFVYSLARRNS